MLRPKGMFKLKVMNPDRFEEDELQHVEPPVKASPRAIRSPTSHPNRRATVDFVSSGPSPRLPDRQGQSSLVQVLRESLQRAARTGDLTLVKRILQQGDEIRARAHIFGRALVVAAGAGHYPVVRFLLDSGAECNGASEALQAAVVEGHERIVGLLIERGADVRALDLRVVGVSGKRLNPAVVKLLAAKGVEVDLTRRKSGEGTLPPPLTTSANRRLSLGVERRLLEPPTTSLKRRGTVTAVPLLDLPGTSRHGRSLSISTMNSPFNSIPGKRVWTQSSDSRYDVV